MRRTAASKMLSTEASRATSPIRIPKIRTVLGDELETNPDELKLSLEHLPQSKKEVYDFFNLSRTNQIRQGHSPITADSLSPRILSGRDAKPEKKKKPPKAKAKKVRGKRKAAPAEPQPKKPSFASKRWIELVASELFSTKVDVVPRPAEFNDNMVAREGQYQHQVRYKSNILFSSLYRDPRRGLYKKAKDFGGPYKHLCKMVRSKLIQSIMAKYDLVRPRVDTNLGKKKPTRKELEQWKINRARKLEAKRHKRRRVISTKKKRFSARMRACHTCGDYHFRRSCGLKDMKINLMVKQIYQKAELIKDNMSEAWDKIDGLETAYHEMLMRVHRLQSNRVCLGLLTGKDYPGEKHPESCPCVEQKLKEEKDRKKQEERLRQEAEHHRIENEKREAERLRREKILEMRKKRFYSRMQSQQQRISGEHKTYTDIVRFQSGETGASDEQSLAMEPQVVSSQIPSQRTTIDTAEGFQTSLKRSSDDDSLILQPETADITRFEASRRKSKLSLIGREDDLGMPPSKPRESLLVKMMEKSAQPRTSDLIVVDGEVKAVAERFTEEGGMIQQLTSFESLPEDEYDSAATDIGGDDLEEDLAAIPEVEEVEEKPKEKPPAEERKEDGLGAIPFGDFLDLMEVF